MAFGGIFLKAGRGQSGDHGRVERLVRVRGGTLVLQRETDM